MKSELFTVGHSSHSLTDFLKLLEQHSVRVVCDVRSAPYSGRNPQFNRDELQDALADRLVKYVFLGRELGARSEDPSCYVDGQARYDRIAKTDLFQSGLERVRKGTDSFRVALMCAEADPLSCHRTILVCRELMEANLSIAHILPGGELEAHEDAEERLLRITKLENGDLFRCRSEILNEAYDIHGKRIAYKLPKNEKGATQLGTEVLR